MNREQLLRRVKTTLVRVFGDRLQGVVLYGSEARGDARPDSDIDLLVLLDGLPHEPDDSWACIDALYPIGLEFGRPIHVEPVDMDEYRAGQFPLYRHALNEGIPL